MKFTDLIALRCSTRSFRQEMVPADVTARILSVGRMAPISMSRHSSYHITVISRQETLAEIPAEWQEKGQPGNPIYDAPLFIVVSGAKEIAKELRAADASCIVDHMLLAATEEGLGSVYIWGAVQVLGANAKYLEQAKIPDCFVPISGLAVGYPVESPKRREPNKEIGIDIV